MLLSITEQIVVYEFWYDIESPCLRNETVHKGEPSIVVNSVLLLR